MAALTIGSARRVVGYRRLALDTSGAHSAAGYRRE
jgi:hypothetical protein